MSYAESVYQGPIPIYQFNEEQEQTLYSQEILNSWDELNILPDLQFAASDLY